MRILRDPSLASYHLKVVGSLMFIFKVCLAQGKCLFFVFFHLFCIIYSHFLYTDFFVTVIDLRVL